MASTLADGDYLVVKNAFLNTLIADDSSGGLYHDTGGGVRNVRTIETELKSEPALYWKSQLPVIAISLANSSERKASNEIFKIFHVDFLVFTRGLDLDAIVDENEKIISRLIALLHDEDAKGPTMLGATIFDETTGVDGNQGNAEIKIKSSVVVAGKIKDQQEYGIIGDVAVDLDVLCCFHPAG